MCAGGLWSCMKVSMAFFTRAASISLNAMTCRLTCSSAAARRRVMRAAGAQWQRRACGAHATPYHGPLQLLVRRHHTTLLSTLRIAFFALSIEPTNQPEHETGKTTEGAEPKGALR